MFLKKLTSIKFLKKQSNSLILSKKFYNRIPTKPNKLQVVQLINYSKIHKK